MPTEQAISVAVEYPGGRIDRITEPLLATDMQVAIEPDDTFERDIVMLDNAGPQMWKPILQSKFGNAKVIYRIRGDMLRAYREMNVTPYKYLVAKHLIGKVDGAISIEPVLAKRFEYATGVSPIGFASLCKNVADWPHVIHRDTEIRAITLTNCNYMGKIQPLIEYAPVIDEWLDENAGHWHIYGRGNKANYLSDHLWRYDNIQFKGYTEKPKGALAKSNLMLHLSSFDSLPNAILEGMASNLPVITNPYTVFTTYGKPLQIASLATMPDVLDTATDPVWRTERGNAGQQTVANRHSPEAVGQQYVRFFKEILA